MSYYAMNNISEVLLRFFATLNRIIIFMSKISLAIKSPNKSKTLAILTIKLHLADFHMRSSSWKTMDQMEMAIKEFCKTRTKSNVHKIPLFWWPKQSLLQCGYLKSLWSQTKHFEPVTMCCLNDIVPGQRVFFLLPDGCCSGCGILDMCWHLVDL